MNEREDAILSDINALSQQANNGALFQRAVAHFQHGQLEAAEALAQRILKMSPGHADASHLLGLIAGQRGQYDLAVRLIANAIKKNPGQAAWHNTHALALQQAGRPKEAVIACERAIELNPESANVHYIHGNALGALDQLDEAVAAYKRAIELNPDFTEAYNNLGLVFHAQDRQSQALACYRKALALGPDIAEVHNNLGNAFRAQNRLNQALECYRKAVLLKPDYAEAHGNCGVVLWGLGYFNEAERSLRKALELNSDYAGAHYNLGNILQAQGRRDEALACYRKAVSLKPDYAEARWAFAMTHIPVFYAPEDDPAVCRSEFSRELDALDGWFDATRVKQGCLVVGSLSPFYLAYQEGNHRVLLARYGALCARLMKDWQENQGLVVSWTASGERIKVGVVSAHIKDHSVWNALVKGWCQHLDRRHFELQVFHIGSSQDSETAWARSQADFFVEGEKRLHEWAVAIHERQPDVLIYPEIGMDAMTVKLASMRLAPVQVASWGHPETTGLPTMDYFLSAEDIEPPDAQEGYTERLVSLPHLGCCYHPLPVAVTDPDLAGLGIEQESPVFLCPGMPFKYMPQYDHIFTAIARRLDRCQFVFFVDDTSTLSDKLRNRLESAFALADMNINEYGLFIPWQDRAAFYGLMDQADVMLDTIGFSGFNTAMQAVECGLPLVTLEGRFLRGRLASGILKRMGLPELIAHSEEDYIALAVNLTQDINYNQYVRQRIETSRQVLFDDLAPVRVLEDFLTSVVRKC